MKKILLILLLLCLTVFVFSQQNLSVPLEDPVYKVIEYIELRQYVTKLRNAKPYSLSMILDTLNEAVNSPEISLKEKTLIFETIERLEPKVSTDMSNGAEIIFKDGQYRYEDTLKNGEPVSVEVGANVDISLASNFNAPNISSNNSFDLYIRGDISNHFSYNVNLGASIVKLKKEAFVPYTYTQTWGGYLFNLPVVDSFDGYTEGLAVGAQMLPEFNTTFFDNKLNINFSRVRRDWGTGDGSLLLSKTAQPFVGLEFNLRPFDFLSLSSMTGMLEFYTDNTIKPYDFHNAFSVFLGEVFFGDYAYLGVTGASVWAKRFELGYLIPGIPPFLTQNFIGDFDNVLMGLSVGANIPKYANLYYNILIDEFRPNIFSGDFFNKARNMYAFQTGVKVAIPNTAFVSFNIQYSKIEPYMYTHPDTKTPWYENPINTSYVNHGENLGYHLPPNSDELKIVASALPFWFLSTNLSYSLVRHGVDYGSGRVLGSSIDDLHTYGAGINDLKKYFLKDGVYEWIHSLGFVGELDLRFVKDIPLTLKLGYTLSYTHHTTPNELNKSFKAINNAEYYNKWANYVTLSVKIW